MKTIAVIISLAYIYYMAYTFYVADITPDVTIFAMTLSITVGYAFAMMIISQIIEIEKAPLRGLD